MTPGTFIDDIYKMCLEIIYLIKLYEKDLALDNQLWLIWHKPSQTKQKPFGMQILSLK